MYLSEIFEQVPNLSFLNNLAEMDLIDARKYYEEDGACVVYGVSYFSNSDGSSQRWVFHFDNDGLRVSQSDYEAQYGLDYWTYIEDAQSRIIH